MALSVLANFSANPKLRAQIAEHLSLAEKAVAAKDLSAYKTNLKKIVELSYNLPGGNTMGFKSADFDRISEESMTSGFPAVKESMEMFLRNAASHYYLTVIRLFAAAAFLLYIVYLLITS